MRRFAIFCLDKLWQKWFPKTILRIHDSEQLFRRIPRGSVVGGFLSPASIDLPNPSCLRSRWADAQDALHPKCCRGQNLSHYGVVSFPVTNIRQQLKLYENTRASIVFDAVPAPVRNCFAHSEISSEATFPAGVVISAGELNEIDRAQIRANLAFRSTVVILPRL